MNSVQVQPSGPHLSITCEELGNIEVVEGRGVLGYVGNEGVLGPFVARPHPHCDLVIKERGVNWKAKSRIIQRVEVVIDYSCSQNRSRSANRNKGVA